MGRPSSFTQEIADHICAELIEGKSLREICAPEEMVDRVTVCRWLATNDEFRNQYAHAREMQAEMMADALLEIADDGRNDWEERTISGGQIINVVNSEAVQRSKLRVDTRKWIASKLLPKKFGDALDLKHSGKVGLTVEVLDAIVNDEPIAGEQG